jgi:hypothetical protein
MRAAGAPSGSARGAETKEDFSIDISLQNKGFEIDSLSLAEYDPKDDEVFRDMSIYEDMDYSEPIDESKIYRDELEYREFGGDNMEEELARMEEEIATMGREEKRYYLRSRLAGESLLRADVNSDIGNDICKENIRKIHVYLEGDMERERELEQALKQAQMRLEAHIKRGK